MNMDTAEDMPDSRKLWANKGEAVTCVNGHPICIVAKHLYIGDPHSPENFTDWAQPEPDRDTKVVEIRCVKCRGVWIRQGATAYQLHFGAPPHGEWR